VLLLPVVGTLLVEEFVVVVVLVVVSRSIGFSLRVMDEPGCTSCEAPLRSWK